MADYVTIKTNAGPIKVPTLEYCNNIATGGEVDLTEYLKSADAENTYAKISSVYTKTDADNKFMLKTDTPDMSGYYTKTEIDAKNYITQSSLSSTLSGYVTTTTLNNGYYSKTQSDERYVQKSNLTTTLNSYLTKNEAQSTYVTITEANQVFATKEELEDIQVELPDNMAVIIDLTSAIITEAFVQTEEGEE